MAKSRPFSIYLLKPEYDHSNALNEEHELDEASSAAANLPPNSILYLADTVPKPPWWKAFWGLEKPLKQSLKGALVFVRVNDRNFALTFGHTYHNLKPESYEYDFGLITTLNAIDEKKIKSTDVINPEDSRKQRIQSPSTRELTYFDIKTDQSIIKKLAGAVSDEYTPYFKNISGANNVRITSKIDAGSIMEVCEKLLALYKDDAYKQKFPDIQKIAPIKDPQVLNKLDDYLLNELNNVRSSDLVLAIPSLDGDIDVERCCFAGSGTTKIQYEEVYIKHYFEYLEERKIEEIDIKTLKKHRIILFDENGTERRTASVFQSLIFECEFNDDTYHLCEGSWYRIEKDFVVALKNYLDIWFEDYSNLLPCDKHKEEEYNLYIANRLTNAACLDKKNIAPKGQSMVEPCDIAIIDGDTVNLCHIKISTRSSSLSHLFNQGVNSIALVRQNQESRRKLEGLVPESFHPKIRASKYSVTYGIISKKLSEKKSDALPIFSRISLKRAIEHLQTMSVPTRVVLIEDRYDRTKKK